SLRIYDSNNARSQIINKLNKVAPMTQARAENLYILASISRPAASTTLLLNINALPFYNRLKHFVPNFQNVCPMCNGGSYDPEHIFKCPKIFDLWIAAEDNHTFRLGINLLQAGNFHLSQPCTFSDTFILTAMIHTVWTIARMMLYLKVPFGYAAASHIFKRALKSIKQIELHNHRDRKGLRNEDTQDTLRHALQDLISCEIIRTIPPPESDEPNLPITVPDCPLCDLYAKDRADDHRFSYRSRRFNQTRSHSFYNNKKNESAIIPRENTL